MGQKEFSNADIMEGKMYALLAYLSILCIIPLILKKNNAFVLAHGKQGLVLFVAQVGVMVLSIMIGALRDPLMFVLMLMSFVGIIQVIRGQYVALPVVSTIADKITL